MYLIWWYIVLQVLAVLAAPIAFVCFFRCRDRGWAYAKAIGIIIPLHIMWLLAHLGLPYCFFFLAFSVFLMACVSLYLLLSERSAVLEWLKAEWRRVIVIEAVFLAAMLFFGTVRAYNPEIESRFRGYGSEKFMDIMFVNSVHQSQTFPPNDAWFAGKPVNYYWYGYYICSALCKLSRIPTYVGYNLALATAFALATVMAFALVWHLSDRWWAGLCGALALTVFGNVQSFRLYVGWHATKLEGAPYIWDCSRVINPPGHTINEFPYFSFLWGDLHGHVTSLPFTVLVLACAACIWVKRNSPPRVWILGPLLIALAYCVMVGCNNWDLPAYALIILGTSVVYFPRNRDARSIVNWYASAMAQRLSAVILGLVLLLPFLTQFDAPKKSLNWAITSKTPLTEFLSMFGYAAFLIGTYLVWLLIRSLRRDRLSVFGVVLVIAVLLIPAGYFISHRHTVRFDETPGAFDPAKAFVLSGFLLAALFLVSREGIRVLFPGFLERSSVETSDSEVSPLGSLESYRYVVVLVLLSLCILFGTEYVAMSDFYGKANERMNTLFKFHFEVWTMLSIAGGWILAMFLSSQARVLKNWAGASRIPLASAGWLAATLSAGGTVAYILWVGMVPAAGIPNSPTWMYQAAGSIFLLGMLAFVAWDLVRDLPPDEFMWRRVKSLWCVPWFIVASLCLTFTVRGTAIKTDRNHVDVKGRKAPTLDGRAWLAKEHPDDLEVIKWLLDNGETKDPNKDAPYIVEAIADESYSYLGRISAFTGFPAVSGWPNHEGIWRSHDAEVEQRKQEGRRIYTASSLTETHRLLQKYKVDYIILGDLERETFGGAFLAEKFLPYTKEAFTSGKTTVRAGWTKPIEELSDVDVSGRPVRSNENPPVPQKSLPSTNTIGRQGTGSGEFNEPRGVDIGPDGKIYVADSKNGRIQVFAADGTFERFVPDPAETNPRAALNGEYSGPGDVAVDEAGNVYVADTWGSPPTGGFGRVVKYNGQGRFVAEWVGPHGFYGPRGIDIAPNGDVYVADTGNERVQVFGPDGGFKFMWGREGEMKEEFVEPVGIAVHGERVYVCDTGNHRIQIFNLGGGWVGEVVPYGWSGQVVAIEPHLDVDAGGRIVVTDSSGGRLEVFSPDGDPIQHCFIALQRPTGVAVSGNTGVVAETGAHRVRIFSLP